MAQVTDGLRAALSNPTFYSFFQWFMGGNKAYGDIVTNYIKPFPGMKILDIGCGPANILYYLENVDYWGYDISSPYIENAKNRFGALGTFHCQDLKITDLDELPEFDVVLALGLLHHLEDSSVINTLKIAYKALKAGGKLITMDSCIDSSQTPLARFIVLKDRGQNIRNKKGYQDLAGRVFTRLKVDVINKRWPPFTLCMMECSKMPNPDECRHYD